LGQFRLYPHNDPNHIGWTTDDQQVTSYLFNNNQTAPQEFIIDYDYIAIDSSVPNTVSNNVNVPQQQQYDDEYYQQQNMYLYNMPQNEIPQNDIPQQYYNNMMPTDYNNQPMYQLQEVQYTPEYYQTNTVNTVNPWPPMSSFNQIDPSNIPVINPPIQCVPFPENNNDDDKDIEADLDVIFELSLSNYIANEGKSNTKK